MAEDALTPEARALGEADAAELRGFTCSTGLWYEDEVQQFVRRQLIDRHGHRSPHSGHRVVGLELVGVGIIAVGSHESDYARHVGGTVLITHLEVVAVRIEYQGVVLPTVDPLEAGRPVTLGRYLMEVLLSDIAGHLDRQPFLKTIVARENAKSLALCDRIGLTRSSGVGDARYEQRMGRMAS